MRSSLARPEAALRLEFPCELSAVRPATEELKEFLRGQCCSEEDVIDCELASAEACNNAVMYAEDEGRLLPVRMEATCSASAVEIKIIDHTPGFTLPKKAVLPSLDSERGRGLFLIQTVMTQVRYARGEHGNTLLMTRQRNS